MEVPIESVDDLADQTAIEYGTMHGGSTMTFFQVRGYTHHCIWWSFIPINPSHKHAHRLTFEPVKINGPSVMLSNSSPSCPSCLPPLTTGFICFLSVPHHNNSISFSSGRWGTERGTHCPQCLWLTLERKRECLRNRVCYKERDSEA